MTFPWDLLSPAQPEARSLKSDFGLENLGLTNLHQVYWNLPTEALYEEAVFRREGQTAQAGPLIVRTGKHTARSANDKFIVREPGSEDHVWWSEYNRPYDPEKFNDLYNRVQGYLQGKDVFVQDGYAGADPKFRLPIRIVTELAWHSLFARNMFLLPETNEVYRRHVPEFTVICVPGFKAAEKIDSTASQTFIVIDFARRLCLIGNTAYAGEIKKSIFTVLNYLLPLQRVMPMHCSANVGQDGDVALFFGLSGTGPETVKFYARLPRRQCLQFVAVRGCFWSWRFDEDSQEDDSARHRHRRRQRTAQLRLGQRQWERRDSPLKKRPILLEQADETET